MSSEASRWQPVTPELPVLSAGKALSASFSPDSNGVLTIQLHGKLPFGALLLVAASRPRCHYWYQHISAAGNQLTASLDGLDKALRSCGDTDWRLYLGRVTSSGIQLIPLRHSGDASYVKKRNAFFSDDRRRYSPPAGSFSLDGVDYEIIPRCTGTHYDLSLLLAPSEDRFYSQLSCHLDVFSPVEDKPGHFEVILRCPDTMEQPEGFSFHDTTSNVPSTLFFPCEAVGTFSETHAVRGVLDCAGLDGLTGQSELTCVLRRENKLLLRCPVRLADPALAAALQYRYEFRPLFSHGETNCSLSISEDHRLLLDFGTEAPGVQYPNLPTLNDYLNSPLRQPRYAVTPVWNPSSDWQWQLTFPNLNLSDADEVLLCLEREGSALRCDCPVTLHPVEPGGTGTSLTADLSALPGFLQHTLPDDWFPFLAVRRGQRFWYLPLLNPLHTCYESNPPATPSTPEPDWQTAPIGTASFDGETVECCPHWERKCASRLCLRLARQSLRYLTAFHCQALRAQLRFGRLSLAIRCPKLPGCRWTGVLLAYRYKLEADRKEHFVPCSARECDGSVELTASIRVSSLDFTPLYWDIRAVFETGGISFISPVKTTAFSNTSARLKSDFVKKLFFGESARLPIGQQLFLYRTPGSQIALVCQERTPYSGLLFRLKERLAVVLCALFLNRLKKQNLLLVFEKYCCMAQDSGFYFFEYCMEHNMEQELRRKIYYVIDKKSPDYQKNLLPHQDHIIQFMSLRHMIYLLSARLLVSSDSKLHAYAWRCKESIIQPYIEQTKKLVFLQHGVTALKKVDCFDAKLKVADLFVTTSQQERDIVVTELGYQPQDVVITGFARWDVLEDRSPEQPRRSVLVMPTWRNWLEEVSDAAFRDSDYCKNYLALLNSPRMAEYLERYDLTLNFYIHPKFRAYLGSFSSPGGRVRLIPFGTEPLNRLMMECSLLITDYSSVCWDVYYQGKPVLFYQFDTDQYNEAHGSYLDLKHDLFGDRAETPDELFALMERTAQDHFRLPPRYAAMREELFQYIDRNNCQRICEEIRKRNW